MGVKLLGKVKIHEIAKKMGLTSKEVIDKALELKIEAKSHLSAITEEEAQKLENSFKKKETKIENKNVDKKEDKKESKPKKEVPVIIRREVIISEEELAKKEEEEKKRKEKKKQ